MLALTQSSTFQTHTPMMDRSTMSLAILPSAPASLAYGQPSTALSLPPSPSPSKKPRLSLKTTNIQPSVYGKGATSLRLETLSATSPTARNTFRNAHNSTMRDKTTSTRQRPTLTPLTTSVAQATYQEDADASDESVSSSTTTTSHSTSTSASEVPYKLSYNVTSILSNGPIPKPLRRRISFTQVRPMFPEPKRVTFRSPLCEDIKNTNYTMKHSDIESSTSTISTLELSPPEKKSLLVKADDKRDTLTRRVVNEASSPKAGDKRDSSDEEDSDCCPATPIAGRRKRRRQWVWTLGPAAQSDQGDQESKETTPDNRMEQKA